MSFKMTRFVPFVAKIADELIPGSVNWADSEDNFAEDFLMHVLCILFSKELFDELA